MNKYILVVKNTWSEFLTYRLSFVMWRLRNVLQILTLYFLWSSIIPPNASLFGYSHSLMLTYVLGTAIVGAIVFSTRTHEVGDNINSGDLSIFLIRPVNYFGYWFARDLGDKLSNIFFSIIEFILLFLILRPPIFIQTDIVTLLLSVAAIICGTLLFFAIGLLLGLIGFWSPEIWAPRFILFILITFFAGGVFPLDILPQAFLQISTYLPFSYLLYFPIKIYLGQLPLQDIFFGLSICTLWIVAIFFCVQKVWSMGLRAYTAQGR